MTPVVAALEYRAVVACGGGSKSLSSIAGVMTEGATERGFLARIRAALAVSAVDRTDAANNAVARLLTAAFLMLFLELA